ncbi:MAG: DNA alkylation repair protein [Candidatus Zixiibacteriota bacterium]
MVGRNKTGTGRRGTPKVIRKLRQELKKYTDRKYRINAQQFSKEKLKNPWVLRTPILRQVSTRFFGEVRKLSKQQVFELCEDLLESGDSEERFFAFDWAYQLRKTYEPSDFPRFETWLKKHVTGWGSCDHLCIGPLGYLIHQFPDLVAKTEPWAKSRNRWLRRAATVVLIYSVRRGQLLPTVFQVADRLLLDQEDLVQKGYGWMLKEAGNQFPEEVFQYVMRHRDRMPRTALRYAIEKYPPEKRKRAMQRN